MKPYLGSDAKTLAVEILRETNGRIFACKAVKKNGEERQFVGCTFPESFDKLNNHGLIVVREMTACKQDDREIMEHNGYRSIKAEQIREITFDGTVFKFEG